MMLLTNLFFLTAFLSFYATYSFSPSFLRPIPSPSIFPNPPSRRLASFILSSSPSDTNNDTIGFTVDEINKITNVNTLQTLLSRSLSLEDYASASLLKSALSSLNTVPLSPLVWEGMIPPWLQSRLSTLGYPLPTAIQYNYLSNPTASETNNHVLNGDTGGGKTLGERENYEDDQNKRRT